MDISHLFTGMNASAAGLAAQRTRMNAIAENIANVETTRTADGEAYRRQQTVLSESSGFSGELDQVTGKRNDLSASDPNHLQGFNSEPDRWKFGGVKATIQRDQAPFREVYDPAHPDADENGIVKMPNVDIVKEMTDLISASRNFEANATAFNATKGMMKKALEL
ncbi:flagellar basal body rod protein FlgC [candidate division KSB1 bacterium]|nr:flagellar basal body rod protein FlgC [candidate division KSB1 bacterium]